MRWGDGEIARIKALCNSGNHRIIGTLPDLSTVAHFLDIARDVCRHPLHTVMIMLSDINGLG